MDPQETTRIGKRGTIVIPSKVRKRLGLNEGSIVITEEFGGGLFIRPAKVVPVEKYTRERKAEFILNNATDRGDYKKAVAEVRKLGLDPARIPHAKPRGR